MGARGVGRGLGFQVEIGERLSFVSRSPISSPRMNDPVLHATVYFSGHVQGVGFRYSTLQVAKEFEVAGYVQNQPDGRVLLETEGRAGVVDEFIAAVAERMHGHVRKMERTQQKRRAVFQGFEIR